MSDYHILELSESEKSIKVAFHFDTPVGNNIAGKSFADCLKEYKPFTESQVPNLLSSFPTENTALAAGTKYEHVDTLVLDSISITDTNANKEAWIQAKWNTANTKFQTRIQKVLKWWGFNNDVP